MKTPAANFKDLTGQRFGSWLVISRGPNTTKNQAMWDVICDCGYTGLRRSYTLTSKKSPCCRACATKKSGETKRLPKGTSGFRTLVRQYRYRAKNHNPVLAYTLTDVEFKLITSSDCRYCGKKPSQIIMMRGNRTEGGKENSIYIYNGIDRWDNTKGYTFDNCVPCCGRCNSAKMDLPGEEFIAHIEKQYKHLNQ
jgi:hypothetical protein